MPKPDWGKMIQFTQGLLEEQERQKTEKKVQTLLKDKNYDVTWQVNPVTGERTAQLKPRDPYEQQKKQLQLQNLQSQINKRQQDQQKGTIKVIGNALVKYDSNTNQALPVYTAPTNTKFIKHPSGVIFEQNLKTGKLIKVVDEMGNFVGQQPEGEPSEKKVIVISPQGVRGEIPIEQLDEAIRAGYKVEQKR